jgi:hypothetical protein
MTVVVTSGGGGLGVGGGLGGGGGLGRGHLHDLTPSSKDAAWRDVRWLERLEGLEFLERLERLERLEL